MTRRPGNAARRLRRRLDGRLVMLALALLLLTVATSRPTISLPHETFRYLFVLDITQSMNVPDVGPRAPLRRIDWAKQAVRLALERLPCGSEAGLAIFTEYRAFLLFAPVEVCEQYGAVAAMLEEVDWRMAWAARSEVAKGLYSSLLAARELGEGTQVVFLTDGHEAPPVHPQIPPRFTGTPGEVGGVIVGVGGLVPAPIPRLDADGNVSGYWTADEVMQVDPFSLGRHSTVAEESMAGIENAELAGRIAAGTQHLSALREDYLQELARQARLEYHRLESPPRFADFLMHRQFAQTRLTPADLRWIPGSLAMLLMLLVYLVNARVLLRSVFGALPLLLLLPPILAPERVIAQEGWSRERVAQLLAGESADLSLANLRGLDLSGLDFRGVNLRGADLSEASLRGCNLDLAILREATLVGADLREASLFSTVLVGARLAGADLRAARLVGNLTGADLENAVLAGVRGGADMRNQPMGLMRAVLAQARLKGADLSGADLALADLSFADLRGADLTAANLTRADLSGADLSGARLAEAVLTGANVENADFTGAVGLDSAQGLDSAVGREFATFDR